jgi:hypothetical protein
MAQEIVVKCTQMIVAAGKRPARDQSAAVDEGLLNRWDEGAAVLDAKLKAYFPDELEPSWRQLRRAIESFTRATTELQEARKRHGGESMDQVIRALRNPEFASEDYALIDDFSRALGGPPGDELTVITPVAADVTRAGIPLSATENAKAHVRDLLDRFIDDVLSAHLNGFSTTRRDLLRDLLP